MVCTQVYCMKLFATTKDRKTRREKETRREKQTRRREKQSSFLSYWYPTVPIFLSSCPFKLIIFHTLNSFSSTTVLMNTLFFFSWSHKYDHLQKTNPFQSTTLKRSKLQHSGWCPLHSKAWSCLSEVSGNLVTHFNRGKNSALTSETT